MTRPGSNDTTGVLRNDLLAWSWRGDLSEKGAEVIRGGAHKERAPRFLGGLSEFQVLARFITHVWCER